MLYNGEQHRRRLPAAGRHRRRPAGGHAPGRPGPAERARRHRAEPSAARCSIPGPCVYMEKIAGGSDIADLLSLDRPLAETLGLVAERRACDIRDIMVVVLDRPRHEEGIQADPRRRRARAPHHRRRRERLAAGGLRSLAGRPAVGHRRHARGRDLRARRSRPSAARSSAGCGRATTPSARRRSTPATTSIACSTTTSSSRGDDCFFSATGVTDGDVLQGVRYEGNAASTESIVMRSRTGTVRRVRARHNRSEAARLHRRALWLVGLPGERHRAPH